MPDAHQYLGALAESSELDTTSMRGTMIAIHKELIQRDAFRWWCTSGGGRSRPRFQVTQQSTTLQCMSIHPALSARRWLLTTASTFMRSISGALVLLKGVRVGETRVTGGGQERAELNQLARHFEERFRDFGECQPDFTYRRLG